jgi:hypothetical protein
MSINRFLRDTDTAAYEALAADVRHSLLNNPQITNLILGHHNNIPRSIPENGRISYIMDSIHVSGLTIVERNIRTSVFQVYCTSRVVHGYSCRVQAARAGGCAGRKPDREGDGERRTQAGQSYTCTVTKLVWDLLRSALKKLS